MLYKIKNASGILFFIFTIIIWEIFSKTEYSSIFFPSFLDILYTLKSLLMTKEYIIDIFITLEKCFKGFIIAILVAIPSGVILGLNKNIYNIFEVFIEFFRPMPSSALIPIAILFLGIGDAMKISIIFFGSLWPILINTIDGVKHINPMYKTTAKIFNLNQFKLIIYIVIPAALPQIFSGLKISIAISLILTITVEMLVGGSGLGYFIIDAERSFLFKEMYASVFTIGILGYLISKLILFLERKALFWK